MSFSLFRRRGRVAAALAAGALTVGLGVAVVPQQVAEAAPPGSKDVTATLFEWTFASVAQACTSVLGPKGYGYVEVSPAQEHIQGPQWWTSYQPVSYQIAGRLGNRAAFQSMVNTCHTAGVKVIADAVINHMVISGPGTGTGGSSYTKYNYPGIYQDWDFHSCRVPISNYSDRGNVQNCELGGLADLDTGSEYVRNRLAAYLNDLISLGVDGFRIDAAKHMAYTDLAAIKSRLTNPNIFWVYEVIYGAGEAVQPGEYVGNGDVDEFRYAYDLKRIFTSEKLAYLSNFGESWGYLPSNKARGFIDNWDTERNHSTLDRTYGSTYTLANVFMLAHPYGSPNVYSGYEVTSHDGGPPNGGTVTACFQNGWTCQHAWRQIANMVAFRTAVAGTAVTNWWSNGNNAIAFGRGTKGFVVINREGASVTQTFQTSLPAGNYCDVQHSEPSGGCSGPAYVVGGDGRFTATVGAGDAVALHVNAKVTAGASFNVNATTSFGQNIFVVGSHAALGAWNTAAALPLSSAAYPIWRLAAGLPPGTALQYKYIRKDSGGVVTWESGANRTTTVPASGLVTLNDTWRP